MYLYPAPGKVPVNVTTENKTYRPLPPLSPSFLPSAGALPQRTNPITIAACAITENIYELTVLIIESWIHFPGSLCE